MHESFERQLDHLLSQGSSCVLHFCMICQMHHPCLHSHTRLFIFGGALVDTSLGVL